MQGERVEKIGVTELKSILPGETKTFFVPSGAKRISAQAQAYKMKFTNPRTNVVAYKCKSLPITDDGWFPISITAVKG